MGRLAVGPTLLALVLLGVAPASAAPVEDGMRGLFVGGAQRGPINIDARRFEVDNRKRTATYVDNVVVRQGDTTLMADRLVVSYDEARRISEVLAEGGVKLLQKVAAAPGGKGAGARPPEREALCGRVVFAVADDRVTCTGAPAVMRQGDDVIRGARITVLVADERIVVEGDPSTPRVTTRIVPDADESRVTRGDGGRPQGAPGQGGSPGPQGDVRPD